MDITLKDKNGVTLHTAKKHCKEDITVRVDTQEIEITPSATEQVEEGLFNKVTVQGDSNLVPENIKIGTNIFGVEGGFDAVDTRDANATINDIAEGTTAYVNNQKIKGTVPNNGELQYEPSDEEQTIPSGITSGGVVKATDITKLNEYEACLTLANSIDNLDDYTDTTATAEDIRAGKTAYSNGERITGTLEALDTTLFTECTRLFYENTIMTKAPFFDTSNVTRMNYMFYGCKSLTETPIFNTSKVTMMNYLFHECASLIKAPFFDTSNVTDMKNMFYGCSALTDVPVLSTSSVNAMQSMFNNCTSLSEESLNNILLMCTTATNFLLANGRTLKYIGLTSAQATVCQGLSNYQAFLDAGWTTGY